MSLASLIENPPRCWRCKKEDGEGDALLYTISSTQFICKGCTRSYGRVTNRRHKVKRQLASREYMKSPAGRESARKHQLKKKFRLSVEEYDRMLQVQGGTCYICKQPPRAKRLAVDHDVESGAVRKLLCGGCNIALGLIKHDVDLARKLVDYLQEHKRREENA